MRNKFRSYLNIFFKKLIDDEDDPKAHIILRHIELIDDEASEYGIMIVKCTDKLMAKKYGYRDLPGLSYFRKGKELSDWWRCLAFCKQ